MLYLDYNYVVFINATVHICIIGCEREIPAVKLYIYPCIKLFLLFIQTHKHYVTG